MDIQTIKQRFGIIGNSPLLNRAIDTAQQVAHTDITVLINGESGVGKEVMPKIIHQMSSRKHGSYIAVNCGAIPEGTIDSELFGHEKGAFTGAHDSRKGYFEVASGGTIFLDEVAELPLSTQVRLLRVLETGEFLRVGSSKVLKTDVRVVAATNVNVQEAIREGKFREDLYYRLSTVPIYIPPLRERKEDVFLIFRKFAADFAEKYRMPTMRLTEDAKNLLMNYRWSGNIRQLKNVTEQISIIEESRELNAEGLRRYLPQNELNELPVLYNKQSAKETLSDRDLLYQVLFDMRKDINDLKKVVFDLMNNETVTTQIKEPQDPFQELYHQNVSHVSYQQDDVHVHQEFGDHEEPVQESEVIEESLSLQKKEIDLIKKALEKYKGKRKNAAQELGISERTLYRKIKEYNIK